MRAYPQGEAPGDSGYPLTGEIRHTFGAHVLPSTLQASALVDTGQVTLNETPFAPVTNHRRLSGGGLGLSLARANDYTLRLSVAHRIGNARALAGSNDQTRGWLQAIKFF